MKPEEVTNVIYWDRILVEIGKGLAILIVALLIFLLGYLSGAQRRIHIPPQQVYPTSQAERAI